MMDLNELSHSIIGAAIEVHRAWVRGYWNPPIEPVWRTSL